MRVIKFNMPCDGTNGSGEAIFHQCQREATHGVYCNHHERMTAKCARIECQRLVPKNVQFCYFHYDEMTK